MRIRPAALPDIPEIQAIYAHHVLTGTGTFEEVPPSVEEMAARFATLTDAGAIWRVAADATGVLGYAYAARYHTRSAYRFTAEDSVYVRDDRRGCGVGRALLAELVAAATAAGFRQMLAVIGDSANVGSIALHRDAGFTEAGRLLAVGYKFGGWRDVVLMQRALGEGDTTPP
ncbi:MAG: GNAT family N-acetyltransferase [Acidibrevibacterium sp.]|uniref:GNAT family N-acetyltransferase n=1 Tax=Acidibrevibacterium sp. TaxID=2606776 RepID=UPI003CFEA569